MGVFLVYGFMSCFWYMDYEILVLSIYSERVRVSSLACSTSWLAA